MSVEATIREKLTQAFQPTRLDVVNESHLHAGHRSSPGTGESHFRVLIVSAAFAGASRVARHRAVNKLRKIDPRMFSSRNVRSDRIVIPEEIRKELKRAAEP